MNVINIGQLGSSGLFILKLASVVLLGMYFIFAFIIVKQVNLMTHTLDVSFKRPLKYFAMIHLIYAAIVLLYAIVM